MDKIIFLSSLIISVPKPGFESAAFPYGLPEALEASVAFQTLGEGTSSDSDHGGMQLLTRRYLFCISALLISP
jgi:hypothetical protein